MQSKLIMTIVVLLLVAGATYYFTREAAAPGPDNGPTARQSQDDPAVAEFQEKLEAGVVGRFGQPIEGFMPDGLLRTYPNLREEDFDGVDASIGHFEYRNGDLVHDLEGADEVHTAAEALTADGYATLFANVSARLEIPPTTDNVEEVMMALSGPMQDDAPPQPPQDSGVTDDGDTLPPEPMPNSTGFIECEAEERLVDACIEIYQPVCAQVLPAGEDAPFADASFATYSNSCFACMDEQVRGYTPGACEA